MTRFLRICSAALLAIAAAGLLSPAGGQATDAPVFEIADVHASAPDKFFHNQPKMRGGRYEVRAATMLDLIGIAYDFQTDKILGGPSWLEMTRYDIIAKAPPESTTDTLKPALQTLLADRFKLTVHKDTRSLPAKALVAGKKPLLKEAAGTEQSGCKPQSGTGGTNGGMIMVGGPDGSTVTFSLGPGLTIQYQCRNITMQAFASGLRGMFGANAGNNPVIEDTGLKGAWNFDLKWSIGLARLPEGEERIDFSDALEKQLGLKLEQRHVPTPVLVVDKVNEKPTANATDIAARLNVPPPPTEFDVAAIKPTAPDSRIFRTQVQPGNRVNLLGMTLQNLIWSAWNLRPSMLIGSPDWLNSDRYDIIAKVAAPEQLDLEDAWPLVQKLLAERFELKVHMEERPVSAYTLTTLKNKMKKADPESRAHIQNGPPPDGKDPRAANPSLSRLITCRNITMAQFAANLQNLAGGYFQSPVRDATGLEGGWDFTLNFSPVGMANRAGGRGGRGGDALPSDDASDPGGGLTIFDAMEKQLGLKLVEQKRPVSVVVIDHIERKPTDN